MKFPSINMLMVCMLPFGFRFRANASGGDPVLLL